MIGVLEVVTAGGVGHGPEIAEPVIAVAKKKLLCTGCARASTDLCDSRSIVVQDSQVPAHGVHEPFGQARLVERKEERITVPIHDFLGPQKAGGPGLGQRVVQRQWRSVQDQLTSCPTQPKIPGRRD